MVYLPYCLAKSHPLTLKRGLDPMTTPLGRGSHQHLRGQAQLRVSQSKTVQDVVNTLLGSSRVDKSYLVKLRQNGWAIACKVFHPPLQWTTKDCNTFMAKHLPLVPKQEGAQG